MVLNLIRFENFWSGHWYVENLENSCDNFMVQADQIHKGDLWLLTKETRCYFKGADPAGREHRTYHLMFSLIDNGNYGCEVWWGGDSNTKNTLHVTRSCDVLLKATTPQSGTLGIQILDSPKIQMAYDNVAHRCPS